MRKKVDKRILTLVENGVKARHRSLFVVIGDKGRDQIVTLHYMLSKAVVKSRPSVLWCYKKKLALSSHRKKRERQLKKQMQRGLLDPENENPFSLFVSSTNIRYCYYAETENILGNTYGMCVLQDFEALTPNLLARTIETVEGGGIIVLLLSSLTSLTSLYTMMMDVHARFRTESHADVTGRFNERFILSLASCKACIFMDDELNFLQVTSQTRTIAPLPVLEGDAALTESERELKELKESLHDTQPAGSLINKCKTLDQGKAVLTFLDAISEKTLRSTVALTASRGRGKSAALGLAIAGAVAFGYSNIFVTAPSPENLKTLFEFVCKGFDALDYKEHMDYDLVQSTNPAFNKAVVRINVFRQHRQTIQYVQPQDHEKLAQAELLVIDEAAAIPLPMVKALLGPYLVFLCSTVNGYEGTGRSLSLKLIQQLREQGNSAKSPSGRAFREVELAEPIRYAVGDPIEAWLHELLCLNAANHIPNIEGRLPPPHECQLFYVNRDTLFSYHKASEAFLQRMMSLYVASHYKNTPNDLQLMSDAPAHHLFVLLGPVDETQNNMPDILCVLQVCLEGKISRSSALKSLGDGSSPSGDQIPWKISQQFQDSEFPSLSGARVVRIAVHPNLVKAGYGTAAINNLIRYYEGEFTDLKEDEEDEPPPDTIVNVPEAAAEVSLQEEQVKPRSNLPPLLVSLKERKAEKIHYVGVSYGLTRPLHNFWTKLRFSPVYISQSASAITGEHTCMVLRATETNEVEVKGMDQGDWVKPFNDDFRRRFVSLLGCSFRHFSPALALSVLNPKIEYEIQDDIDTPGIFGGKTPLLTPYDMKRLQAYANNLADYHLIMDLVPTLARLYFLERMPVTISPVQASILLSLGLQQHDFGHVETQLDLPRSQLLALFDKVLRRLHGLLHAAAAKEIEDTMPRVREVVMNPHAITVDEDLDEAAKQVEADMKQKLLGGPEPAAQAEDSDAEEEPAEEPMLNPETLQHFAIENGADFESALGGKVPKSGGLLSVRSSKDASSKDNKKRSIPMKKHKQQQQQPAKKSKKRHG